MGQYGHAFDSFISKRIEDIQSIQEICIGKVMECLLMFISKRPEN